MLPTGSFRTALAVSAFTISFAATERAAYATESATSFYLLGSKGSMAGVTPPPGTYLVDLNYYYAGSAKAQSAVGATLRNIGPRDTVGIPITVNANLKVDANAYYQIPNAVVVLPGQVLGGNLGFSIATPLGWKSVDARLDARASISLPPPISRTFSPGASLALEDDRKGFGDPIVGAFIGWHQGNLHWNVGTLINVPIGVWNTGRLANIGFNHWAFDFTGAVTWLDPAMGLELSAAAGVTFNTENPDTNYKSGTDFHLEFAAMKSLSKQLAVGVSGYHYQQLTGDTGSGAKLGSFKGQVTAVGPALNYNFQVGPVPVSTSLKWTHEFNVENRLKGDMAMFTLMIPVGGPPPMPR